MKKQSTIHSKRNEIKQQYRKEYLKNVFVQHRRTLKQETTKFEQQQFNRVYPRIDEDNFQSYLSFIHKYSCNYEYNFRLVVFGGYLYQFMVNNPQNFLALQILQSLSYYEELQFPQTQKLAQILVQNLQKHSPIILQIVYNLLQTSKYSAYLRDYLIQLDFNQKAQHLLKSNRNQQQKQLYDYLLQLYLGIIGCFISTYPLVQSHFFQNLLKTFINLAENNSDRFSIIFNALCDLFYSLEPDKIKAELVLKYYGQTMIKQYYNYEYQIICIILYGVKSGIFVGRSFWKLLSSSLQSINSHTVELIVLMCENLTNNDHFKQQTAEMFLSNNFLNRFIKAYDHSKQKSKLRILSVLTNLANQILVDQQEISEENRLNLHQLSNVIKNGLQSQNRQICQRSIDLIFFLLQIINENSLTQLPLRQHLQEQGVVQILSNMQMQQQFLSQKIQYILGLLHEKTDRERGQI